MAASTANSTARRLSTGSTLGMPRHTGHTLVLGGAPKRVEHEQKILVSVSNWTCTSSPITGSYFALAATLDSGVVTICRDYRGSMAFTHHRDAEAQRKEKHSALVLWLCDVSVSLCLCDSVVKMASYFTFAAAVVVKLSVFSAGMVASCLPVAAATPVPAAPPAPAPMAAPLPPPAIPPMMAPRAAPPPILVTLLLPWDSPLTTSGCTVTDDAIFLELMVLSTRLSSPGSLRRPDSCTATTVPVTSAPLGKTCLPATTMGSSKVPWKMSPAVTLALVRVSIMRT